MPEPKNSANSIRPVATNADLLLILFMEIWNRRFMNILCHRHGKGLRLPMNTHGPEPR